MPYSRIQPYTRQKMQTALLSFADRQLAAQQSCLACAGIKMGCKSVQPAMLADRTHGQAPCLTYT